MNIPNWVYLVPFVEGGRDKSGADCWGLIVLLYKHFYDIDLEKYEGIAATDVDQTTASDEINKQAESGGDFYPVDDPQFGDVVLLRISGRPVHVAFCIGDSRMVHTGKRHNVVIENFEETKWKSRVLGFYRKK